jgi:ketosteroid isomerase-like protein
MPLDQSVITFFEILNTRDMDQMRDLLNEDAELYFPKTQPLIGKERILKFMNILFRQYPELTFGQKINSGKQILSDYFKQQHIADSSFRA